MANRDTPNGLTLSGAMAGGSQVNRRKYNVDASNSVAIYQNAPVKLETDGNVAGMSAASDDYVGVVSSIMDSNGKSVKYLAASTAGTVIVVDDPKAEFEIQFENGGSAPTSACIGDMADLTSFGGNTDTGVSTVELSETLVGDGNSAQFRILELINVENNTFGHNARVRVIANEHAFIKATVAV